MGKANWVGNKSCVIAALSVYDGRFLSRHGYQRRKRKKGRRYNFAKQNSPEGE